ncbi:MAG: HD domain-containing protein [Treponema sp.]|jgi:exopolyphosphatase/guanosine-5'-triphosphate,3'-diphosphate pyrophosphatase|nr:HD domain-containing protein [Treponema sp.]
MEDPRLYAVIEIGSTGIRLLVAENNGTSGDPRLRILDESGRPVALGRDVFSSGAVSRESFLECLSVLEAYQEQLGAWGLDPGNIRIIATSAIRAARNREIFTDRVRQETGLDVTVIEGIEENRLMYLALRFALKNDIPRFWRANTMILDVGGGSTEIMLLRRGKMVCSHSLRLGTIRMDQKRLLGSDAFIDRYLKENVRSTQDFLNAEMDLSAISTFAAAGSDVRQAASRIGKTLNEYCRVIGKDDFTRFVKSVEHLTSEECGKRYNIPNADAEGFVPGLLIYRTFLERTSAEELIVPGISVREGYLLDLTSGVDNELRNDFYSQISASAVNLGRKYRFDEEHSRHVARLCLELFDALEKEHGMNRHERMMLEVASILHDVGMFIRGSGHHRHGQYIVANSEIFGLKQEELDIIGNVIRYHRDAPPSRTDIEYLALQKEERILVLKMTSLLRIADALDRGHSQRIKQITVEKKTETLVIRTGASFDLSLEELGMKEKSDLLEDVFGYKVVLG